MITAKTILSALASRHTHDLFIPECKDGPSCRGMVRLDAWAMKKSWADPTVFGYEIKMTSADFAKDQKWHQYLPLCNQLFFVCPYGLLQPEEMPGEVGLLWLTKTGSRLYQKRKAAHRKVDVPESLFRYILMWRASVKDEHKDDVSDQAYWENWLRNKVWKKELGTMVSKRIREYVWDVERENKRLKEMMGAYEEVRAILKRLGIDSDDTWVIRSVETRAQELKRLIPRDMRWVFKNAYKDLQKIVGFIHDEGLKFGE